MQRMLVFVPATKGYFVLHYRAPESVCIRSQPIFDNVTADIEPVKP